MGGVLSRERLEREMARSSSSSAQNRPPRSKGQALSSDGGEGEGRRAPEGPLLVKYAGATVVRTETNNDSTAPYESHIETSAGKELEVLVSKTFEVVDANERPSRR